MESPMFKIPYGLYVVTTRFESHDNGCISNTFGQVTAMPNQVSLCLDKSNFTCEMIQKSGVFTASVLSEKATFSLFQRFGFQSGRDVDKFKDFEGCRRVSNGTFAITEGTNAFISAQVVDTVDLGTHIMFIGKVTEMETLDDVPSVTYSYYQKYIKPKPENSSLTGNGHTVWRCKVCGYEYVGEELPADYVCPAVS